MKIGDRIKEKRLALGYSVEQVADLLGKNRATVYRYESNEIENFPITILEPLAKVLKTTPGYLMGWDESYSDSDKIDNSKVCEFPGVYNTKVESIGNDLINSMASQLGFSISENDDNTFNISYLTDTYKIRNKKMVDFYGNFNELATQSFKDLIATSVDEYQIDTIAAHSTEDLSSDDRDKIIEFVNNLLGKGK